MKTFRSKFVIVTSYFFILLFCYAAISKVFDFENFQVQLAQSPLTNPYSPAISYVVIALELIIVFLLSSSKLRLLGLHASFTLMVFFTVYIYVILNYSDNIPCSCGGVLEDLGWSQHLIFNIVCAVTALIAIVNGTENKKGILLPVVATEVIIPSIILVLNFYPIVQQNQDSFVRKTIEPFTSEIKMIDLPKSNHYIAGNNYDSLFLGNSKTPLLLTKIGPKFDHLKTDTLKLDDYGLKFQSVRINVLYPYFSVTDGKVPVIFEGEFPSLNAYRTGIRNLYFSKIVPTGQHQYVFRAVVTKTKKSELGTLNTLQNGYTIMPKVLESEVEGIFATDGNISVNLDDKKIFYTYLYRNEIVSTDVNLNNMKIINTIDSFSKSNLKTKKLSTGQIKLMQSPQEVNVLQTICKGHLYNLSKIRGKEEYFRDFSKKLSIDVYDVQKKTYLYSYNFKSEERSSIKGILRTKKYFYVLFSDHITRYTFK